MDGRLVPFGFLDAQDDHWERYTLRLEQDLELKTQMVDDAATIIGNLRVTLEASQAATEELTSQHDACRRRLREYDAWARQVEEQPAAADGVWWAVGGGVVGVAVTSLVIAFATGGR